MSGAQPLFPAPYPFAGTGWTASNRPRVLTGDFTGDGRTDLIGQTNDGTLGAWESTGDLSANGKLFPAADAAKVVGTGWRTSSIPRVVPADVDGDGTIDLVAQLSDGHLRAYRSNGEMTGSAVMFPAPYPYVGTNWTTANRQRILVGDLTGDGRTDLIGQHADGTMLGFASTGDLSADYKLYAASGGNVGSGWTTSSIPRIF